jgi:hypothetical protein
VSRSLILGFAILLIALATLSFFALSDNFFFYTLNMTFDSAVVPQGDGYELSCYTYGNKETTNQFEVATLFYAINPDSQNMARVTLQIWPIRRSKVYSMSLDVRDFQPVSALVLENPESGQPPPFKYTRTDYVSSVTLDFPEPLLNYGEPITIDFWLDLQKMEPVAEGRLVLETWFSVSDDSVFKIAQYDGDVAVLLDIPAVMH